MSEFPTAILLSEITRRWSGRNSFKWEVTGLKLKKGTDQDLVSVHIKEDGTSKVYFLDFVSTPSTQDIVKVESTLMDDKLYNPFMIGYNNRVDPTGLTYDKVRILTYRSDDPSREHHTEVGELELNGVRFVWEQA